MEFSVHYTLVFYKMIFIILKFSKDVHSSNLIYYHSRQLSTFEKVIGITEKVFFLMDDIAPVQNLTITSSTYSTA